VFLLFVLFAVSLFMLIAAFQGPQAGVTIEAGVGISLLFSLLIIGCLVFLLRNTGIVVLIAEGVALRRLEQKRFLCYGEIVALKLQANLVSSLLIQETGHALRIPHIGFLFPERLELLYDDL